MASRVLICIPHFFAVSAPKHQVEGSSHDDVEVRARTFLDTVRQWSSLISERRFTIGSAGDVSQGVNNVVRQIPSDVTGDVIVCISGDDHLLGRNKEVNFRTAQDSNPNPRLLPYLCRKVFSKFKNEYDLFIYTEDDTVAWDPLFIQKILGFYGEFGEDKLIVANRYELFSGYAFKVYLECSSPEQVRLKPPLSGPETLVARDGARFEKTDSPFMGFYAITRSQLSDWESMPHFASPSLALGVNELEEAMVPMLGRRPIYRPAQQNMNHLEIHHVPNRACHARTPHTRLVALIENRTND